MAKLPGKKLELCGECEYEWWHKVRDIEADPLVRCPNCGERETETLEVRSIFES